jgi:hypothetical protein
MADFEITSGPDVRPVWAMHKICTSCLNCETSGLRDPNPQCLAFIDIVTGGQIRMFCREVRAQKQLPDNIVRFRYPANKPHLQTVGCGPEGLLWDMRGAADVAADHKG